MCERIDDLNICYGKEVRKTKNGKFFSIVMAGISGRVFLGRLYNAVLGQVHPLKRKHDIFKQLNSVVFYRGPNFQPWEIDILHSPISNQECSSMIANDQRNYGRVRSLDTIRHKRKTLALNIPDIAEKTLGEIRAALERYEHFSRKEPRE
jgi:hypothetical protein